MESPSSPRAGRPRPDGTYRLPDVPRGCLILTVRRIGYESRQVRFVAPADSLRLDVRLEPTPGPPEVFRLLPEPESEE